MYIYHYTKTYFAIVRTPFECLNIKIIKYRLSTNLS